MYIPTGIESRSTVISMEAASSAANQGPIHGAICRALSDEPQDMLAIIERLSDAAWQEAGRSPKLNRDNAAEPKEIEAALASLMRQAIVDQRYNLYFLTVRGRDLVLQEAGASFSGY